MPGTCPLADCNYEERPAVNASLFLLYARNLSLGSSYLNITLLRQHSVVASLQMRMQNSLSAVCSR